MRNDGGRAAGWLAIVGLLGLGGCAWFEDEPAAPAAPQQQSAAAGFPDINSVPQQAPRSVLLNLDAVRLGLAGDSGNARYAGPLLPVAPVAPRPLPAPPVPPTAPTTETAKPEGPAESAIPAPPPTPTEAPTEPAATPAPQLGEAGAVAVQPDAAPTTPALPGAGQEAPYGYAAPVGEAAPAPLGGGPIALVYFDENSTELDESDRDVIRQVAELFRRHGGVLRVIGHASRTGGGGESNEKVSMARANAIADALAADGVPAPALRVAAAGDRQPATDGAAGDAALDRRAEIFLTPY